MPNMAPPVSVDAKAVGISMSGADDGIPLSKLNPDTDGDGSIEPWEKEAYDKLIAADEDGSGYISVKELVHVPSLAI